MFFVFFCLFQVPTDYRLNFSHLANASVAADHFFFTGQSAWGTEHVQTCEIHTKTQTKVAFAMCSVNVQGVH